MATSFTYVNLFSNIQNQFGHAAHSTIIRGVKAVPPKLANVDDKYKNFDLLIYMVSKEGVVELKVDGPLIAKRSRFVEYTVLLPVSIPSIDDYYKNVASILKIIDPAYDADRFLAVCILSNSAS